MRIRVDIAVAVALLALAAGLAWWASTMTGALQLALEITALVVLLAVFQALGVYRSLLIWFRDNRLRGRLTPGEWAITSAFWRETTGCQHRVVPLVDLVTRLRPRDMTQEEAQSAVFRLVSECVLASNLPAETAAKNVDSVLFPGDRWAATRFWGSQPPSPAEGWEPLVQELELDAAEGGRFLRRFEAALDQSMPFNLWEEWVKFNLHLVESLEFVAGMGPNATEHFAQLATFPHLGTHHYAMDTGVPVVVTPPLVAEIKAKVGIIADRAIELRARYPRQS